MCETPLSNYSVDRKDESVKLKGVFPVLITTAALAGCSSTDQKGAEVASAEIANPDEVTCRTVVKTGTRIGTKVCKTNRAWKVGNRSGRNMAEDVQRRALQSQADRNAGN